MSETEALAEPTQDLDDEHGGTVPAETVVDYDRIKRWVMQRDGKDYIQYAGLLDLLHQTSQGRFNIHTHLVQPPTDANGMLAIVEATVSILVEPAETPPWGAGRQASGLGDASPGSVNRMMAPHLVRMAETRAKGRALRDLLNIPLVTIEELGPGGPVRDEPRGSYGGRYDPAGDQDTMVVDGKSYTRDQLWGFFQQRRTQCRERNISFPQPALQRGSPLVDIVRQTQEMRRKLEEAGAFDRAQNRFSGPPAGQGAPPAGPERER